MFCARLTRTNNHPGAAKALFGPKTPKVARNGEERTESRDDLHLVPRTAQKQGTEATPTPQRNLGNNQPKSRVARCVATKQRLGPGLSVSRRPKHHTHTKRRTSNT